MFRRMIRRSFTAHRGIILIRPIIIQAMCLGWGWHLAQDSYWEQRGQTIGAIAIGAMATLPLTTTTISIETTSTISIVVSKAENGSTMRSIAAALLTEIGTQLTSTAAALDNGRPAELTVPAVLQVSAVELLLPEEQAIDPVEEQLEISERVIVPAEPVPPIVRVAEPDSVRARQRVVVPAAVRAGLDPVPARRLVWAAVETTLVIGVCPRARALVRAATLLVAPDLAALPLRDQPAVEEAIAWAAVASAVEDAVAAEEEVGGNRLSRKKIKSIPMRRGNRPTMTGPGPNRKTRAA